MGRVALGGAVLCALTFVVGAPAFAAPADDRADHERCRQSDAGLAGSLLEAPSCAAEEVTADEQPLPPSDTPRILEPDLPELPNLDAESDDDADEDGSDDDGSDSADDTSEDDSDEPGSEEPESGESESGSGESDMDDTDESGSDESDGGGSTGESDTGGEDTAHEDTAEGDTDDEDTAGAADGRDEDTEPSDAAAGSAGDPPPRDSGADTAVGNVILPGVGDAVGGAASSGLDWTGVLAGPEEDGQRSPSERSGDPEPATESTARVDPRALAGPVDDAARALPPGGEPTPAAVAFAQALPSPAETGRDARAILPSLLLTLLLLAALALPAGALDRAAGEHTDRVDALLARLRPPQGGVGGGPTLLTAVVVTAMAGALLLGFLAPAFPLDGSAPALLVGLTLAFVVVTVAQQGPQVLYLRQWWGVRCHLVPFPGFLLLGVFGVVLSRAVGLEPGLVLGTLTAFGAARPLRTDEEGPAAALAATALTAVGGMAWILRDPLISAAGMPGTFPPAMLGVALTAITVAAVTNLVFALAPVSFLLGAALLRWSPTLWALFACTGGLGFVHLVARPAADGVSGRVGLLAALLGCYLLTTGALWYWLRHGSGPRARPAHSASEPVTESIRLVNAVSTSAAPRPSGPAGSAW